MKRSILMAFAVPLVFGANALAGTVYLDDSAGNLYAGDPTTGIYTLVGNIGGSGCTVCSVPGGAFADIDFTSNGTLYGVDQGGGNQTLYTINPSNGLITGTVGTTGSTDFMAGLAGDSSGNLYAGGTNNVYQLNTSNGTATAASTGGMAGGGFYSIAGDLEFIGGTMYGTAATYPASGTPNYNGGEFLQIDPATGIATDIGATGFRNVYGLAYDTDNGILYGFDYASDEFSINLATGAGTLVAADVLDLPTDGSADLFGAAFITSSTATPEPSSFGLGLLGAALLLGFALHRKALPLKASTVDE